MKLLAQLCAAQVPFQVLDHDDIEKLAVLRATRFVDAEIPPVLIDGGCCRYAGPAVVVKVTDVGQAAARGT
jgi:hypothetical protein